MSSQLAPALLPALEASGFAGTWETDLATGTVYPSGRFADLLGLDVRHTADGVSLAKLLERIHGADRERVGALVHEAHRTAGRFEAEFRTLGAGGTTHWVAARGQVETDARGRGLLCRGIAIDITDTRRPRPGRAVEPVRILGEIADIVLNARRLADGFDSSLLRTLLDILLLELGKELAKTCGPDGGSLH